MPTSQGFRGLRVYQLAFKLAMEIFHESKKFPREELYSLTDQIRRASRSVASNIGEGYRRKIYPKMFVSKMVDADGEGTETQVWIEFAFACLTVCAICGMNPRVLKSNDHMFERPFFSPRVQRDRHRRSTTKSGQQQVVGRCPFISSAV